MKKLTCILLAGCFLVSCSSKKDDFPTREKDPEGRRSSGAVRPAQPGASQGPRIQQIAFVPPNPTSSDVLRAVPALADESLSGIEYRFQWFVNLNEVKDETGDRLNNSYFKKKDWVHCRVQAFHPETNRESAWIKSNMVGIGDSPPTIEPLPVGDFSVPGIFRYRISASDFDNDELKFRLLSPLDAGIRLDSGTGQMEWNLDEATVNRLGEAIEIRFEAVDGDGATAGGSIRLNLRSPEQTTNLP